MRAVFESFQFSFLFCKIKGCYWWKCQNHRPCAWNPGSRLLQVKHKSKKWRWQHNLSIRRHHQFFDVIVLVLSSSVTNPSFMSMSILALELRQCLFVMDLTRNLEIGNTPIWVLSNIWRLVQVRDTKFDINVFNEKLLNPFAPNSFFLYPLKTSENHKL